jgi:hypothetical protein
LKNLDGLDRPRVYGHIAKLEGEGEGNIISVDREPVFLVEDFIRSFPRKETHITFIAPFPGCALSNAESCGAAGVTGVIDIAAFVLCDSGKGF